MNSKDVQQPLLSPLNKTQSNFSPTGHTGIEFFSKKLGYCCVESSLVSALVSLRVSLGENDHLFL